MNKYKIIYTDLPLKSGDKITRKDGKWKRRRFATVISEPDEGGVILARFGTMGKYFAGYAKNYIRVTENNESA